MAKHQIGTYKDDAFKIIPFCKICGYDDPKGDCPGKFVPNRDRVNDENKVDTELQCK